MSPESSSSFFIAIGASTGGTEATLSVIRQLPVSTPGIVVVQHMPEGFTSMYAQRLNRESLMDVKEARSGDRIQSGRILIAPGGHQMTVHKDQQGYFVICKKGEKISGHCPSVDALFFSIAKIAGGNTLGIILTGMGADGAKGLLEILRSGGQTIGQNKESCVVYGMPMEAYKLGAVQKQLPLSCISGEILRISRGKK